MAYKQGKRIGARTNSYLAAGAVTLALSACCSDGDKKRVDDVIDKFEQRATKLCERVCDDTVRDQCFVDLVDKLAQLVALQIGYLAACDNGDTELMKDILKQIRDIIGGGTTTASSGLGSSQTGVHNVMDVFAEGDTLQLDISASPTGNSSMVVLVSDGQGATMSGSAALAVGGGAGDPCNTPPGDTVVMGTVTASADEYAISSGTVVLLSAGVQWDVSVSGTFVIAWNEPDANGNRDGVPTAGELRVQTDGVLDLMLILDGSQPETIAVLDEDGNGFLAFKATVSPVSLPTTLVPNAIWLELPLHVDATNGAMEIGTGGIFVSAEQIAPRAPFPVADADTDMIVTNDDFLLFTSWLDSGDSRADATHDGVVDTADLTYFLEYWNYEMNR